MKHLFQLTTEEFETLIDKVIDRKLSQYDNIKKPPTTNVSEELIKIDAVAKYFKVTHKTIHNWVKSGKIKRHYKGGRSYYKRSEIEKSFE